jgi:hypothetical protein
VTPEARRRARQTAMLAKSLGQTAEQNAFVRALEAGELEEPAELPAPLKCPVCRQPTTLAPSGGLVIHRACVAEMDAAERQTAACSHRKVNEYGVCLECGGLRGDDGSFEAPVRRPRLRLVVDEAAS